MWMLTSEEDDPTLESIFLFLRYIGGGIVLAFGVLLVVSLIEHRSVSADRYLDFFVMALMAGTAGASAGAGRRFYSNLRLLYGQANELEPAARSLRRQYRAVYWFGMAVFSLSAGIVFLLAVSIGTGHGEWVSWIPELHRSRHHPVALPPG
jgi:hypothetical protein